MGKLSLRWGQEAGYQSKIKSFDPKARLSEHGITGKLQTGDLGFSRTMTKREAKRDAADAIPPSDATSEDQWSEREQIIAERAENLRRGLSTWFKATAGDVRNFIQDCTPSPVRSDQVREAIKSDEGDLRQHEKDDSSLARAEHSEARAELEEFKKRHKGKIGERTPDIKTNVEQTVAVLLAIMILEGGFNALLFKDAQGSGLLGGVLVAFGVSAVNVCFGVVAGFFGLRFAMNHWSTPVRVLGGVIAGIFMVAGLLLNFFVAHFRDAVEAGLHASTSAGAAASFSMFSIAPGDVIAGMFPNIFGLSSLVALGLLFIGLAVFAMAVYEGYEKISDRYPGYGRVWRKERMAYERRQMIRIGLRDDLSEYFTECRAWFDAQQTRHINAKREIEKAMTILEARREQAISVASRAADQERGLKIAYRQAHRRMRNALRDTLGEAAAIPAYFDEIVTPKAPELDYGSERSQANDAILAIDTNISELNESQKWLEQHIQEAQKGLASIDAGFEGDARSLQSKLEEATPEITKSKKAA